MCGSTSQLDDKDVKWAAQLAHVREVSLHGTAELGFWRERLLPQRLVPAEQDGRARIMITAADGRFRGLRFRELSFSVRVAPPDGATGGDAAFLVHAFNSSRFFAFCERTFFSTPYHYADVRVSATIPASAEVVQKGAVVFSAVMGSDVRSSRREPARSGADGWEGPIFLPEMHANRPGKYFFGRIGGHTETFPFENPGDSMTLNPQRSGDVLHALIDSAFTADEWHVRTDATHAKSKTYTRTR